MKQKREKFQRRHGSTSFFRLFFPLASSTFSSSSVAVRTACFDPLASPNCKSVSDLERIQRPDRQSVGRKKEKNNKKRNVLKREGVGGGRSGGYRGPGLQTWRI